MFFRGFMTKFKKIFLPFLFIPLVALASGKATVSSVNQNAIPVAGVNSSGVMVPIRTDSDGILQVSGGGGASAFTDLNDAPAAYTGQASKVVRVNSGETALEFATVSGTGTVTSVDVAGGTTGLTTSGGPITASGTVTLAGTLTVANGGTGSTTASNARTALGLAIGTNVQAQDATLQSVAALGTASDKIAYTTGVDTWAETAITSAGRAIIDDADAAAQRTTLGLGTAATTAATDYQPIDSDLTAVAGMSSNGIIARTGTGTVSARTITAPAAGITLTNGDGVSGNPTLALANDLSALEAISATNVFPYRTGTDTWSSATFTPRTNCTPTVTLVGGAGNTVPQYTTNTCRYTQVSKLVFWQFYLNGDGGNEGAGTGVVTIDLPVAASSSQQPGIINCGTAFNGSTFTTLFGTIAASATTMSLSKINAGARADFTGADQINTTRSISCNLTYEAP